MGYTVKEMSQLLRDSGMNEEHLDELFDSERVMLRKGGVVVYPSADVLMGLSPQARAKIYAVLANFKENPFHYYPIVIQEPSLRTWFRGTGLNDEILVMISKLVYFRGRSALFSDVSALLNLVHTAKEERELIQALTRVRSLVLRMSFDEESDFDEIANYWSAGYKYKDILPMIESIGRNKYQQTVDLAHFIPPTPRRFLYSFPAAEDGLRGRYPDSFWSALNFFNFSTVDVYGDSFDLDAHIRRNYRPVEGQFKYGDILLMVREDDRQAYHACIYLADNIVFTKNTPYLYTPWTLMTIEDLFSYHERGRPSFLSGWRRLDLWEEEPPSQQASDALEMSVP